MTPLVTRVGTLVLVPNPCTTEPCLPGMALALDADGELLVLTQRGGWLPAGVSLPGRAPALGQRLRVRGELRQGRDIHGDPFLQLELEGWTAANDEGAGDRENGKPVPSLP